MCSTMILVILFYLSHDHGLLLPNVITLSCVMANCSIRSHALSLDEFMTVSMILNFLKDTKLHVKSHDASPARYFSERGVSVRVIRSNQRFEIPICIYLSWKLWNHIDYTLYIIWAFATFIESFRCINLILS